MAETGSGILGDVASLTCAVSSFYHTNFSSLPHDIDIAVTVVKFPIDLLRTILGLFLNGLLVFLVIKFKKLRNISFSIASQIATANLLLTLAYSISIIHGPLGQWLLGLNSCIAAAVVTTMLTNIRGSLIFLFSLDRFCLVFFPFRYPKHSLRMVTTLCVILWCLSLVTSLIPIPSILDCYLFDEGSLFCYLSHSCNPSCLIFRYVHGASHTAPVVVLPIFFFTALYVKGRKLHRQISREGQQGMGMKSEDWRALNTYILLLLPSILYVLVLFLLIPILTHTSQTVRTLVTVVYGVLFTTLVVVDPIIFMRNKDIYHSFTLLMKIICSKHNYFAKYCIYPEKVKERTDNSSL